MSSSKKSTSSKKQSAARARRSNGPGKKGDRELIDTGTDKRYVRRDAATGSFVEKANDHMERAWGKIYERTGKAGASKK